MYKDALSCAVVGLGIGEQHAFAIMENARCSLSKLVELDKQKAINFIESNKLKDVEISSFPEILRDADLDLVSIASFDDDHYGQIIESLRQNKHVFVEKPLCQTRDQLNNIYKEWNKRKCGLGSNLVLRKAPLYLFIKELISQGLLGEIYAFDGDYLYGRVHKVTDGWRKDVENYSVMQGGGIHMIDLMLELTGQKPVMVSSNNNKIVTKNTCFRYHDFHSALFTFESGMIGRITANFGCMHPHQHVVRIFGTKGTFIFDDMGARIHWKRDEKQHPQLIQDAPKPKKKGILIHDLIDAITQNQLTAFAQREFDLMSAVLAADESLNSSQTLKIDYLTC